MAVNSIFKHKNFSKLFFASAISEFGSFITDTGLMLYLYSVTNESNSWLGLSKAVFILSYTLGTFFGGGLRNYAFFKKILLFSNLIRIPLLIAMSFLDAPHLLISFAGIIAFFQGVFTPLRRALTNIYVPKNEIKKANSITSTTYAGLHLACPYIGALIYTEIGSILPIYMTDLFTYVISFFLILSLQNVQDLRQKNEPGEAFKFELNFLSRNANIKTMCVQYAIVGVMVGILIPLLLPFTLKTLGGTKEHYGIIMFCFGLGGLIGGLTSNSLGKILGSNKLTVITFFIEVNMLLIWSQITSLPLSYVVLLIWGTVVFIRIPAQFNFISETVPTKDLAVAHSIVQMCFVIPNFTGGMVVAIVGDKISAESTYFYSGIFFSSLALWRALSPSTKKFYKLEINQIDREYIG